MTLHLATIEQLIAWQSDIVNELARRAGVQAAPVAAPPWEMHRVGRTATSPTMLHIPSIPAPVHPGPQPPSELDALRARLAAMEAGQHHAVLAPPNGAPAMLGGQAPAMPPGSVLSVARTTVATDPVGAAIFAQQKPRAPGVPGPQGNGRGMGGQIGFGGD